MKSADRSGRHATLWLGFVLLFAGAACKTSLTPPPEPVLYPPPPNPPRIQYLRHITTRRDVAGSRFAWVDKIVGPPEAEKIGFVKPYGLAVTEGKIYVCDTIAGTVWVVGLRSGQFHPIAGDRGRGRLTKPINIAVDAEGRKYVTDSVRNEVVVFGPDDAFDTAFGDPEGATAPLAVPSAEPTFRPIGVAVDGDLLFVGDLAGHEIQVRDKRTGALLRAFGSPASTPIEEAVGLPVNLAVDSRGNVLVSDLGRYRIARYSPEGVFLGAFGRQGRGAGEFARPKGIAVDRADRVYVVDTAFENVQMFDEAQRLLMWFGGHGPARGSLALPAQVAIDSTNLDFFRDSVAPGFALEFVIWVTCQTGSRKVCCYGFLRPLATDPARK